MQSVAGFVWAGAEDGCINAFDIQAKGKDIKPFKVYKCSKQKTEPPGIRCLLAIREFSDLDSRAKTVRVLSGDTTGTLTMWKVKKKNPSKRVSRNVIASFDGVINCMYQEGESIWVGLLGSISVVDIKVCESFSYFFFCFLTFFLFL